MIMSQAIVDPEELRRFAGDLKMFSAALVDQTSRILARMNNLGNTWKDSEHRKFVDEFQQTIKTMKKFQGECEEYVAFLHRKAKPIEDYQRR
jgi:uncharacterized protein YukE